MMWQHFLTYLNMGGFGDYVWSAFGISLVVILWLLITSFKSKFKVINLLRKIEDASSS